MTTETIQGTRSNDPRRLAALILGGLLAAGALALLLVVVVISPSSETKATDAESGPATVENDRVILTEEASERLGIETGAITDSEVQAPTGESSLRKVVPYSAVLYGVDGGAFVYTNPEPLTFARAPITIESIKGDAAVLSDGPASGTTVVTVGSAELFGAEFEFEE
ncbi:MAG: hypothetical protein E6I03_09660 [Chloroflexi bacterium]|nr:MAG: hypothetical protein E6I03_09660 [Chloroflexota bacterium]